MTHTPGPWRIGAASGHNPNTVFAGDEGIASVYGIPLHVHIDALTDERHQAPLANARLIAAAPDLLEALKLVADSGKFSCFFDDAWDAVNAAIAKAEGRS